MYLLSFLDSDHHSPEYQSSNRKQNDEYRNENSSNYFISVQFITVHNRSTVELAVIVVTIAAIVVSLGILPRDASWGVVLSVLGMRQEEEGREKDDCVCFHWKMIIINGNYITSILKGEVRKKV